MGKNVNPLDNVSGIAELVDTVTAMQAEIDMLNAFVEDVMVSLAMPEITRYYIDEKYDGLVKDAMDELSKHMFEYRKILDFLRRNRIDINKILSDTESKGLN